MNKIPGYDESPAYTGEGASLPAGKYICEIKGAKDSETQSGTRQLILQLDIAEGDYKGYYSERFRADGERLGTRAKWANGGLFRQGYEGKGLPFFKGMIKAIEESNPGFKWDWDEKRLKGKKVGVLFGREQFRASDGTLKWSTKAVRIRSIKGLQSALIPEDKPIADNGFNAAGFSDVDEDEDLPF